MSNQNKEDVKKMDKQSNNGNKGKGSNRSRGRGSNSKPKNDSEVRKSDFKSNSGCNDISWYAQDATLLRNSANFPWSTQSGLTYDDTRSFFAGAAIQQHGDSFTSPGIHALHVIPGLGNTAYQLDAVNVAANAMYVYIRHMNSGAKNYDAPDLMMYILAMDEVFTMISWLQRLYGTIGMYNVYNRYMPDALLRMQGIDPDELKDNMVQFRYRLNTIIKQAATLVVPNSFPIFSRHTFLFRDYYIEGDDMKDQVYMYTPVAFRKFRIPVLGGPGELFYDDLDASGGNLIYRLEPTRTVSVFKLLDYLQDMVSRIYLDEDFGTMAGDILKAYGESNVVKLQELPDAYICTLHPNNEVLLQMKNANISSVWRYFDSDRASLDALSPTFGNIVQDPNSNRIYENLRSLWTNMSPFEAFDYDRHMLTLQGDPSPEMNMIMSRLIHDVSIITASGMYQYICGTELVALASVCVDVDAYTVLGYAKATAITTTNIANNVDVFEALSSFKYHPRLGIAVCTTYPPTSAADVTATASLFQVDNFTFINSDMLDRLHQVAIMSEFNVPHMALIK